MQRQSQRSASMKQARSRCPTAPATSGNVERPMLALVKHENIAASACSASDVAAVCLLDSLARSLDIHVARALVLVS
jgi:hypothetical protein